MNTLFKVSAVLLAIQFSPCVFAEQSDIDSVDVPNFLPNLPPWELYEEPPQQITEIPPVVLVVDSKGSVFNTVIVPTKNGTYKILKKSVTEDMLAELSAVTRVQLKAMEFTDLREEEFPEGAAASSSYTCPLPSSFNLTGLSTADPDDSELQQVYGAQQFLDTDRPVGATTQWVTFDFYTEDYRGSGSHTPIALFHDEDLHGWGGFIGDNSESPFHCSATALFNSQIEGWIQLFDPGIPGVTNQYWQSYTFNGPDSCGNEMYDGSVRINIFTGVPRYRMEMHASTGHWVAYRIWTYNKNISDWEILTPWKEIDVDTGNWSHFPLNFDNSAEGIFIGATPQSEKPFTPWAVRISNTNCGWF